jgi:hypothetical protein
MIVNSDYILVPKSLWQNPRSCPANLKLDDLGK